jgi:hypothetical protein
MLKTCALQSCKEKVDALVFVFSYTDSSSFAELPQLINKMTKDDSSQPAPIIIGTRLVFPKALGLSGVQNMSECPNSVQVKSLRVWGIQALTIHFFMLKII